MKKGIYMIAIVFLASCAAKKLTTTEADAKRGAEKYPGYTLAMLNEDKKIYEEKCSNCHGLKNPKKKAAEKWPGTVKRMAAKAEKNSKKRMTETDQEAITRYLVVMSQAS